MPRRKYALKKRTDRPDGPYYVFWTEAGRQRKRRTPIFEESLARAEEDRLNFEHQQRHVFGKSAVEANVTFAFAAARYVKSADTPEKERARARYIEQPIKLLGDLRLADVGETAIREAATKAYPAASAATRRRQFFTPVVAVLNFAASGDRQWCARPAIKKPAESAGRIDWLSPQEVAGMLGAANEREAALVALIVGAGLRASEAARLQWKDTDLSGSEAWIWESKNGRPRKVELPAPTVAALACLPHREGSVFLTPKGEPYIIDPDSGGLFNNGLASLCARADVRRVTMHALRHTWATWFYSATRDLIRLKMLGGWSSLKMVERYAHLAPRGIAAEIAAYGWYFGAPSQVHPDRQAESA